MDTQFLIVGAGPFGLAAAAQARQHGIETLVLGRPMGFWEDHMPTGMILRSEWDWHLDPLDVHTIEAWLAERGMDKADITPFPLDDYLAYARWFQDRKGIEAIPRMVRRLDQGTDGRFKATLENGETLTAKNVLLALGFACFPHEPAEYRDKIPVDRCSHTCDQVDFTDLAGKRCLIIGGRQSAFEWAALLAEAGADRVDVCHRHDTPAFATADWSWVGPLVDGIEKEPGWFRNLSETERQDVNDRLWREGRLKVEPWLWPRLDRDEVTIRPLTTVTACRSGPGDTLTLSLSGDGSLTADHVILATGYKVDMGRLPLLNRGNLRDRIETRNGSPVLDLGFQTSVPGLYVTSLPASQDFGPFFGFTIAVRASARMIIAAVEAGA